MLDISRPELSVEALQESLVAAAQFPLIDEAVFPEQQDPDLIERRLGPGKQAGRPSEQIANFRGLRGGAGGIFRPGTGHSRLMHPLRRLQAPFGSPAFDLARLNAELPRQLTVGHAVVARHESQSTACTRDHEPVRHGTPVIVASMHKHHAARLFLTAERDF